MRIVYDDEGIRVCLFRIGTHLCRLIGRECRENNGAAVIRENAASLPFRSSAVNIFRDVL